jgi:glycosyltransferase involved in cell wall biosynthesis
MRVAIVDSQVPFFHGGAELLGSNLADAMRALGHEVETGRMALNPAFPADIRRAMDFALREDTARWIAAPDVVVALRFPAYLVRAANKRVWLLHQLRQYYEYFDETRAAAADPAEAHVLKERIAAVDREALEGASRLWTMSRRVAERTAQYNGMKPAPSLWPPLPVEGCFYRGRQDPYIFAPSRLEQHKRQWLLIEAMAHVKSGVKAVIGGGGGGWVGYQERIERLGLGDRVLMTGPLAQDVLAAWYANALAVFFGPLDEDYGFVTLEAMLSGKPVITCRDSGGPLDFVVDGENGRVADADPRAIAAAIDALAADPRRAAGMGMAGYDGYRKLGLTWEKTASVLLGAGEKA